MTATIEKKKAANEWADSVKGIIVAFTFALVFRAFVIEGFEIPTGSMAPTLMGQHTLITSPATGYTWPAGPAPNSYAGPDRAPSRKQSYRTVDPMSGAEYTARDQPLRAGDMVFILKYLFPLFTPSRYDVVVFKNPRDPSMNYIKRLIGLGPEELAIVDGDVFSRPIVSGSAPAAGESTWSMPGWKVTRKPESVQRTMWQPVFDTAFTPLTSAKDGRIWFRSPWKPQKPSDWTITDTAQYAHKAASPATLSWDNTVRAISDYYAYNLDFPEDIKRTLSIPLPNGCYPVSDVRVRVGYQPGAEAAGKPLSLTLAARAHQFRWSVADNIATIEMRPAAPADSPWELLSKSESSASLKFVAGVTTDLEFWHTDQSLSIFVNGKLVASGEYNWTLDQRLTFSMGLTVNEVVNTPVNLLTNYPRYSRPGVAINVPGVCQFSYISLDRDIHYQAADYPSRNDATPSSAPGPHSRSGQPAAATHPRQPIFLNEGEYFMCGDNSPSSLDARLWDAPFAWVGQDDNKTGVIGRDALIGHAFVVYFPGAYWRTGPIPVPDAGRVRLIR